MGLLDLILGPTGEKKGSELLPFIANKPNTRFTRMRDAIGLQETNPNSWEMQPHLKAGGTRYDFVNPEMTKYGQALGKYQTTEGKLEERSEKYLGRKYSRDEFLKDPRAQERFTLRDLMEDGAQSDDEIIGSHFGGDSNLAEKGKQRILRPEIASYIKSTKKFLK